VERVTKLDVVSWTPHYPRIPMQYAPILLVS